MFITYYAIFTSLVLRFHYATSQGLRLPNGASWMREPLPGNICGRSERCVTMEYCVLFLNGNAMNRDTVLCDVRYKGRQRIRKYCCSIQNPVLNAANAQMPVNPPMFIATPPRPDAPPPIPDTTIWFTVAPEIPDTTIWSTVAPEIPDTTIWSTVAPEIPDTTSLSIVTPEIPDTTPLSTEIPEIPDISPCSTVTPGISDTTPARPTVTPPVPTPTNSDATPSLPVTTPFPATIQTGSASPDNSQGPRQTNGSNWIREPHLVSKCRAAQRCVTIKHCVYFLNGNTMGHDAVLCDVRHNGRQRIRRYCCSVQYQIPNTIKAPIPMVPIPPMTVLNPPWAAAVPSRPALPDYSGGLRLPNGPSWMREPLPGNICGLSERCVTMEYCVLFLNGNALSRDTALCDVRYKGRQRIMRYCCSIQNPVLNAANAQMPVNPPMFIATPPRPDAPPPIPDTPSPRPDTPPRSTVTPPIPDTTPARPTPTPPVATPARSETAPSEPVTTPFLATIPAGPGNSQDCGISRSENFVAPLIMGGRDAEEGEFPWTVAVLRRTTRGGIVFECGGFLIDRRHVLTAAHCLRLNEPDRYGIRLGNREWRLGRYYNITSIAIPPGYSRSEYYDDIAVLTLAEEVTDPNVVPVCLPDQEMSSSNLTGLETTVVGWGATSFGGDDTLVLNVLSGLPVISDSECASRLSRLLFGFQEQFSRGLTRGILCAGFLEGGRDSCGGDSGGPLMIERGGRYYAIGVVSFGIECGNPGSPAGYTRISEYMDFIRMNTQND